MPTPWRQAVALDPAPSNQTPVAGNLFVFVPPATLAGNPLLIHSNIANLVGNKVTSVTQMVAGSGAALTKIDELLNPGSPAGNTANGGCAGAVWHLPNPVAMNGGDQGTATGGSTTTLVTSKNYTLNQWAGKWVKDYSKNQIVQVTSNTAGPNSVLSFPSGSMTPANGDLFVIGDWLEFAVTGNDDYNSGLFLELDHSQGIPQTAIGALHSAQQPAPGATITAGTDAISTGSANLGTGTVLQIGFFEDDVDNGSPFVPNVGSSGTSGGTFYSFNLGAPIMRVIYRTLTNPGTIDMKATAQATDHFQAFMVGFVLPAGAALAGDAIVVESAAAQLTTAIQMGAAAQVASSAIAGLMALTGNPSVASVGQGSLSTQILATATALAQVRASGNMNPRRPSHIAFSVQKKSGDGLYWPDAPQGDHPTQIVGGASAAVAAQGTLTSAILAGGAATTVASQGALTTAIRAAGHASVAASATAALTTSGGGGGSAPPSPTAINPVPDPLGGLDVFFTGPDARSISPLTAYTATLFNSPSGTAAGISTSVSRNATTGGLSAYIRFDGVPAGQYTVQVTATNSGGTSTPPATSSAFTVVAPTDYYVSQGHATSSGTPQNPAWSTYGGQGGNYADTTGKIFPGEVNAISIAAGGLILPFFKSAWCADPVNGNWYLNRYGYFVMMVYGTSFANEVNVSYRWASQMFGITSTGGANTFTDNAQNFVPNPSGAQTNPPTGLVNSAGSVQVFGGKAMNAGQGGCSNTVNSVTDSNGNGFNWNAVGGQRYIVSYGDQDYVLGRTNSQPVVGGVSQYTIAQYDPTTGALVGQANSLQPNVWNKVAVPISVMNQISGPAGNYLEFYYPGAAQELRVQNTNSAPIYVTDMGFTVNKPSP